MAAITKTALGTLERQIMDIVWAHAPVQVRDVLRRLRPQLAHTTVMTTLDRLHTKGFVTRSKTGNAFLYQAALTRDEFHRQVVTEAVAGLLKTSSAPVMAAFVDVVASADEANLTRLERLIAARRGSK